MADRSNRGRTLQLRRVQLWLLADQAAISWLDFRTSGALSGRHSGTRWSFADACPARIQPKRVRSDPAKLDQPAARRSFLFPVTNDATLSARGRGPDMMPPARMIAPLRPLCSGSFTRS